MRVLLTGAAGFIGSHLCECLLEGGADVIGVDNFLTGNPRNIAHLESHRRFRFAEHDVIRPYTVAEIAELVIELTGSQSVIVGKPLPVDDPRRRRPDISVARHVLGWEPRVPVRQGLARTIAHYRERLSEPMYR